VKEEKKKEMIYSNKLKEEEKEELKFGSRRVELPISEGMDQQDNGAEGGENFVNDEETKDVRSDEENCEEQRTWAKRVEILVFG